MMDITNKIEELRLKINLSESKKKTDYQEGEEEKFKNGEYISALKENIASLKISESNKSRICSSSIKGTLFKEKQSRELIQWFDQWILDTEKQINLLTHVNRKLKEKISKLEDEKLNLSNQPASTSTEDSNDKKIQELENNLEKMLMKISEAEFVEKKYVVVITILEEEILLLQKESVMLDSDLVKANTELDRFRSTAENALKASRAIQSQLIQENSLFQQQKCQWEQSLRTFHQQVDNICSENFLRKSSVERLPSANETFISCEESSSPATEGLTRSYSKDMMEKFKLSLGSGETIMLELNDNIQIGETITNLQNKVKSLQIEKDRLKEELECTLDSTRLSPIKSPKYQQLDEKLKEQQERRREVLRYAEIYTKFMETVRTALRQLNSTIAIGCKLNSVGSPSPDDTIELLAICLERVEFLVEQSQNYDKDSAMQIYEGVKFSENVEEAQLMLKPKSKNVKRTEQSIKSSMKFDEYDSPDQEVPTRATIKRQAKAMIDHHIKMHAKGTRTQTNIPKLHI